MSFMFLVCSGHHSRRYFSMMFLLSIVATSAGAQSSQPVSDRQGQFNVLAFYAPSAEPDHVQFAEGALNFFSALGAKDSFTFDATSDWTNLNDSHLKKYQLVLWLNESPNTAAERLAFQHYMEGGGAWLGFHSSGYNDKDTNWPWFVDFLGGAVFDINSWPPLPARLIVDDRTHPATANLPEAFVAPANEWYVWRPSPRLNKDVRVLVTFDPSNYPIGLKDVLARGDLPVVWTNTKYKMVYMNMGHGDKIFTSPIQNRLIENAVNWLGIGSTESAFPPPGGTEISPRGVVLNSKTHKAYAVSTAAGTVTVVDPAGQFAAQIKVGTEPEAIAINPITNRI